MILFFILLLSINSTMADVSVREMYKASTEDEVICIKLFELLKKDDELNYSPTKLAFYGGTLTLMALYSDNPIDKLTYSRQANKALDRSIKLDPENFDGRSLRILYNANVPIILSDHTELKEDIILFNSLISSSRKYSVYNEWMISIINEILSKSKL